MNADHKVLVQSVTDTHGLFEKFKENISLKIDTFSFDLNRRVKVNDMY